MYDIFEHCQGVAPKKLIGEFDDMLKDHEMIGEVSFNDDENFKYKLLEVFPKSYTHVTGLIVFVCSRFFRQWI